MISHVCDCLLTHGEKDSVLYTFCHAQNECISFSLRLISYAFALQT